MQTMLRFVLYLVFAAAVGARTSAAETDSTGAAKTSPPGSLVIIGGALRYDYAEVWQRIVELAGGRGAKIAVLPTASAEPLKNGSRTVDALRAVDADAFLVPLYDESIDAGAKRAAADPKLVEQIDACRGVFFIGGSQERITAVLGSSARERTPVLDAIWRLYERGGVVAGASAGAAVMSRMMFRSAPSVLETLQNGVSLGKELAPGLGFLDPSWFVEQHCLVRGRFARSLVAMQTLKLKYGVGIDDNTAVVIRAGREMNVIGYKGAIVMDVSAASTDATQRRFNIKGARLTYVDRGDTFDLQTLQLTPSAAKLADQTIDPNSPAFTPARDDKLVVPDILGNSVLVDLMARLIENKSPEATGLAFDTAALQRGPSEGFEFRLYRGPDSRAWHATSTGAAAYTIANIHLDILPVEFNGPLYK